MMGLKERLLGSVFRLGRYHAWLVVLFFLLVTAGGVYYGLDVPLRSSFLDLLPGNDPLINEYRENEQYFAQSDYVALLVTLVDDVSEEEREGVLLHAAETISDVLSHDEEFEKVTYLQEISPSIPDQYVQLFELTPDELLRIEDSVTLAREAVAGGGEFTLLPDETLGAVYQQISRGFTDALYTQDLAGSIGAAGMSEIKQQLAGVQQLNLGVLQAIDGLDGLGSVTQAVRALSEVFTSTGDAKKREPTAFLSRDKTRLVMTVQPRYPSQRGVEYSAMISERLTEGIETADPQALGVRVGIAGTYSYNAQTTDVVNTDMLRTTVISSIGVFLIFFFAFRSVFYSIIAVIPLLISVVLTMCWAKFAVGGFNLVTTFLPALVLGLGIDYAIHMISRYAEERGKGRSLNRSLLASVLHKGEASFFAAMTTALVFLSLLTSKSRAMSEMGTIASVGVMIAFAVTLFLLPALITLSHFLFHSRRKETVATHHARLNGVFRFITGRGRAIFVIVLVLTFFVAFQAARTSFVFSSNDLVPRVQTQDVMEEILTHFDVSPTGLGSFFTFYASSEGELRDIVSQLSGHPLVEVVDSAVGILPVNLTDQQQTLSSLDIPTYVSQLKLLEDSLDQRAGVLIEIRALLTQFALLQYAAALNGHVEIALVSSDVITSLRALQLRLTDLDTEAARSSVVSLRAALEELDENLVSVRDLPPVETLLRDILQAYPEGIRSRYLTPDGDFVIQARISRDIYDGSNLEEFAAFASSFSDHYFGMPLVAQRLEDYMKRDFYLSTSLALVMILLLLWRSLRGWMRALLAATPLVLGYIWMLGGMRLLSIDFNFLSMAISPLLIGIGVDNGIHILHRTMEERALTSDGAVERGASTTAVAVIVTSLTTMLVFGSLIAARTPGLRMLGVSALLGIGFSLLFSLLFLPAALHIEGGRRV